MSTALRSDLVIPEILADAIRTGFTGMAVMAGSPCAIMNGTLPNSVKGGDTVKVPYFGNLGEMDDLANEGDALTPVKLTMSSELAPVLHSGKAFEISDWALMAASYADPYGEAAKQIVEAAVRRADLALIKAERGDRWGNLTYRKTARNFGPIMAAAAKCTIAQVREIVPLGALDPEVIVTPGIFVKRVVQIATSQRAAA